MRLAQAPAHRLRQLRQRLAQPLDVRLRHHQRQQVGIREVPVVVRLGLSDGTSTEIAGKDLTEGVDLVIGQAPAAAGGGPFSSRLRLF